MCLESEMGNAWNARRGRLRIWYPKHRQESQEMGGFMKKTSIQLSVVLFLPVPCVHCLYSEPSHGVWPCAGAALLPHPSISLTHLCTLAWPGALCPAPVHTQPFLAVTSPLPPSDPLLQDVPSRTGTYNSACGVFLQTPYLCWCWSLPWPKEVPPSPLSPCPGQKPEAFVPALGETDGNCLFTFYLFSFLFFFPAQFLWSVPIPWGNLIAECVTCCDAVDSVCVQWRRGHFFVR